MVLITISLSIDKAKLQTDDASTPSVCDQSDLDFLEATFSSNLQPEECEVFNFGSSCIIENDPPSFIMPRIRAKSLSNSIKECLAMLSEVSHHAYKIEDNKKSILNQEIFINQLQDNNQRNITLNQNFTCKQSGIYKFESNYRLPNKKIIQNIFCLNIASYSRKRYLQISCIGALPQLTNFIRTQTYTIYYPQLQVIYEVFPFFTPSDCFPRWRYFQYLESLTYFDSGQSTFQTNQYPLPQDFSLIQNADGTPFLSSLDGERGLLSFQANFIKGRDLVGTSIVYRLKNYFDNTVLPYPLDYTTLTINMESSPQVIDDITVYLNQPLTQPLDTDAYKIVSSILMIPRVQGGLDANLFVQINLSPQNSLEINPQFGNQINTYDQSIMVDYQDGFNNQIDVTIQVKVSYPYLMSEPNFNLAFNFGRSYNFTDLPNIVYSDSYSNPSLTFNVFDTSKTEITSFNPLTYTSVGKIITFNCFQSNGISLSTSSYNFTIKLSEDSGSALYGPYQFQVTLVPPVFVDELKETLTFLKQQIAIVQLPDVYPADTSISVTQASGAPLPQNVMNFDQTSRKMTYFFDQSTAGTVSTFILNFDLKSSTGNLKTYTQTITFNDISSGVWFETPPPNITSIVGELNYYPFPRLIENGGTFKQCSLIYPGINFFTFQAAPPILMLNPSAGNRGIYPCSIGISNNEGKPDLFYNFTVTVPNSLPEFDPPLINQKLMLGFQVYYELSNIVDLDTDPVTISLISNNGSQFISFDAPNQAIDSSGKIFIDALDTLLVSIGKYSLIYELDDGFEKTQFSLNIEIYPNTPPQFNTTMIPFISNFIWTSSDSQVTMRIPPAFDIDGQPLTITVTIDGNTIVPSFITFDLIDVQNAYFIFSPITSTSQYDIYPITVTVSDSIDITSFEFQVTVKNSLPTIIVIQNLLKVYDVNNPSINDTISLQDYFLLYDTDIDTDAADAVSFSFKDQILSSWITKQDYGQYIAFNLIPYGQSLGKTEILIYAKDSYDEYSETSVTATFILDRPPYYSDISKLDQVLICCNIQTLTLPTPLDNADLSSQIKVTISPQPWLTVLTQVQLSVDTNQLASPGPNLYTIILTDSYLLTKTYTGSITLNHRPEWTPGISPLNNITVMSGGEIRCVEYGSIYSSDPDSHIYNVQIQIPSAGLPQGLIVNIVNSTNITFRANSGISIGGYFKVVIFLKDIYGAMSLTSQILSITLEADPLIELPLSLKVNKGPPFFVGLNQFPDITMQIGQTVRKQLPKIDDPDSEDTWSILIENLLKSGLFQFTTLTYPSLTFSPWDSSQAGFYIVTLVLKDNRHKLSRYSFNLIITDPLFMDSENNITTVEKDQVIQNDTTETIQDTDSNLFSNENNADFSAKKKVYLPRRVIAEQGKLSQELRARISSINSVGELTVQFNRDVKIPTYYNSFNQSILEITLINKTKTKLRELQEIQSIEVSNLEKKLQFNWGIKSFSSRKIIFKIDFQDPLEISQEQPNYLQVKFIQNGYFIDKFTGKSISLNYSTTEKVPKQMIPQSSAANYLSKNAEIIKLTISTTLQANFIINILLSTCLQFLWGMINTLQLIVRLPLFNLKFPANSQILFSILLEITNFQFFNYQPLQEAIFTFSETQPINQQFEDMGYLSVNAIENLGMVFYTFVFILIVYAMIFLIRIILRLMNAKAELIISKIENWLTKKLLYNTLIRFFIESYIEILVSSMVQFNQLENKTSGDRFSAFIGVFFALICIIMPFILIFLIRKYHSIIQTKDSKLDSINTIFENLSTSSPATLYYTPFFMVRRLLFALSIIFMNYIPMLQIFTLFVSSLATIIYLLYIKPFDSPLLNRLEIFNEFCLYLMSYPCLMFTEVSIEDGTGSLSSSTHFKYNMGWIVVGGVLLNIGVNMLIMIVMTIRMAWRGISQRLKCMKKNESNAIQENSQSNQNISISIEQKGDLTVQEYENSLDENKELAQQKSVKNQEIDEEIKDHAQFIVNNVRFSKVQPIVSEKIIEENSDQIQDYSKCQNNSEAIIDNQILQELSREIIDKQELKVQKGLNKKKIKVSAQIVSRKNEDFYPQALLVANLQAKVVKIAPNNQTKKKIK